MTELGNKEVLSKNIKKYMELRNVDRMAIVEATGISYNTLSDWINGKNYPYIDKIEILANFFQCNKADLIEDISKDGRLDSMEKNVVRVPLLGKIPAGMPFEAVEDMYTVDFEEVPSDWTKGGKEYFALKIQGDSMEPEYPDGSIVVFLKTNSCESGQDCCVMVNAEDATFKRVTIKDDGIILTPLNIDNSTGFLPTKYTTEEIFTKEIKILGVAKKLTKYINQ